MRLPLGKKFQWHSKATMVPLSAFDVIHIPHATPLNIAAQSPADHGFGTMHFAGIFH